MIPEELIRHVIAALTAFEAALRRLHPIALPALRKELLVHLEPLAAVRRSLPPEKPKASDGGAASALRRACDFLLVAIKNFADEEDLQVAYISALRSARRVCRAEEALYPLCGVSPGVNRHFLEPGATLPPEVKTSAEETGVLHDGPSDHPHARGGFSLYVPESYSPAYALPLVVALHGGYSHGRDFLWSWLREARSRGFFVLAPTSQDMTWSITSPDRDAHPLYRHLESVCSRYAVDHTRMLITGMSDGGTYALALALSFQSPFSIIAPCCCALPPADLRQARGKRIFWIHGAQDWIFSPERTVWACRELRQAGADIKLSLIDDLAHTYPREANATLLEWFGINGGSPEK